MSAHYDLVIIGAGVHGLAAAKVYIELHPDDEIVVLEANSTCGGTWAANRLYPELKSNNILDSFEFPDLPMSSEYGVKPGEHIPGPVLHHYFTDYARKFGIWPRIKFDTVVHLLAPSEDAGWLIRATSRTGSETLRSKRVIVATGLTSEPNIPKYTGIDDFDAPFFHLQDLCRQAETLKTAKQVVVVGGGKSAIDVAYAYVKAGAHVDIIIRESGQGPVWMIPAWCLGGRMRLDQVPTIRIATWFSPCIFGGLDGSRWVRHFLHGTAVGRFLVGKFWSFIEVKLLGVNAYAKDEELKKLRPWNSSFWAGTNLSILNYEDDFHQMVILGQVNVHVTDVDHLSPKQVHLTNGLSLAADVLVCATGWNVAPLIGSMNFGDGGTGLSQFSGEQSEMVLEADKQIFARFPRLKDQPTLKFKPADDPPRLYRFMVPPARIEKRDIAFAGMVSTITTSFSANIQALWIAAYFDDKLEKMPKTQKQVAESVALHTQWCKWRYPFGHGARFPDLVFDALPYMDLLLDDLGLNFRRKSSTWRELTEPYSPRDYVGLVDEWARSRGKPDPMVPILEL